MMDTEITRVVFRVWRERGGYGDGVLALFPDEPWRDGSKYRVTSYERVGQHGGADYTGCIRGTRPATPAEYADLKRELEQVGYNLKVVRRAAPRTEWAAA